MKPINLIYTIMLCAFLAGLLVIIVISRNLIVSPKNIPSKIQISQDHVRYEAKVMIMDTLKQQSKVASTLKGGNFIRKSDILFHHNPVFLIWTLLILFMMAIAAGGFPVFLVQAIQWTRQFNLSTTQIRVSLACSVLFVLSMGLISQIGECTLWTL
jgi:hypothetical protein